MEVREIVSEEIKKGMRIIHKRGYENRGWREDKVKTISKIVITTNGTHSHVVYDSGGFDYLFDLGDHYFEVVDDKSTGIPTFGGDLPTGTKLDSDKVKPSLLLDDMPLAIHEILKVLQFGAKKYSEGNWLKVPNGINRYRNAADRHRLAIDELDDESGLLHLAHEATSVLMLLELKLREKRDAE